MRAFPLALPLTVLLAACGATAGPASSPAPAQASPAAVAASPTTAAQAPKPAAPSQAAAATPLVVVYSAVGTPVLPLWTSVEAGIFKSNGLNVDARLMANASTSMAALLAGEAQIFQAGGTDVVSAVVGGADLVLVGAVSPYYPYHFEALPSITSVADLKGKKIGLAGVGDTTDTSTRLVLQQAGLDPDKDVTLVSVGGSPTRADALLNGAIQATMITPPDTLVLEDKGMHSLVDVAALKQPAPNSAIAVQRSWLNANRDVMQRYMDSLVTSVVYINQHRDFELDVMKKYLKISDSRALNTSYDFALEILPPLPYPRPEQYKEALPVLSKVNPKLKDFDVTKIIDDSLVASAAQRGLDKASKS
jgi:ABC-type nitrate/sulfonate/bicarbonate transport system substrate-binding protein